MKYQNLFEALQNICGFIALETDIFEIINAYEKDKQINLLESEKYNNNYESIPIRDEQIG